MITFEQINFEDVNWQSMYEFGELNIFQTLPWLNLIVDTENAKPVVVVIMSDGRIIGYFTGLLINKFGLKILGSPFRGWNTYFMGFNLSSDASRREILQKFPDFVFKKLGCHYLEIIDLNLDMDDSSGLSYTVENLPWFAMDLTKSEEELLANMKRQCRGNIRKSTRSGVYIEQASEISFADEYYDQYTEVLTKHSLEPTYSLESVRKMIAQLLPTGNMLLLRAKSAEGICIATGIFIGLNKTGVFWGAASYSNYQSLRPNEPLAWHGIKTMKARGIEILHFGGEAEEYKKKLGCQEIEIYRIMRAKNIVLGGLINAVMSQKNPRFKNWALRKL